MMACNNITCITPLNWRKQSEPRISEVNSVYMYYGFPRSCSLMRKPIYSCALIFCSAHEKNSNFQKMCGCICRFCTFEFARSWRTAVWILFVCHPLTGQCTRVPVQRLNIASHVSSACTVGSIPLVVIRDISEAVRIRSYL